MAAPVEFYFDFGSPYGYLAATRIDGIAARRGRAVEWRPILLGAVFKVSGMRPNLEQPLRGDYLRHDVVRSARLLGTPLTFPDNAPINSVVPARAFWWLHGRDEAAARRLALALLEAHWGRGLDISGVDGVREVAGTLGLDPDAVEAGTRDEAVKLRLREEVERAVGKGVFGSPFVIVDGEPFWGADRLDQAGRWMEGGW